jgi:SAM-dependent methyltransferase
VTGRSLARDQRDWTDLGQLDPLWAVWSTPEFRNGGGDPDAFFRRGQEEIDELLGYVDALRSAPLPRGRALDFGCGAGRLTQALAARFDAAIGVDIAPSMVATARRLSDRSNCAFELNPDPDLHRFADREFDLVCSLITLQHVSDPAAIERYIADLIRVTRTGGVTVFQLPSHVPRRVRAQPRRQLYRLARTVGVPAGRLYGLGLYSMALTAIPRDRVERLIAGSGAELLAAAADGRTGSDAIPSLVYYALRV